MKTSERWRHWQHKNIGPTERIHIPEIFTAWPNKLCRLAPSASSLKLSPQARVLRSTKALSVPEEPQLQATNPILGNREGPDARALGDKGDKEARLVLSQTCSP